MVLLNRLKASGEVQYPPYWPSPDSPAGSMLNDAMKRVMDTADCQGARFKGTIEKGRMLRIDWP